VDPREAVVPKEVQTKSHKVYYKCSKAKYSEIFFGSKKNEVSDSGYEVTWDL